MIWAVASIPLSSFMATSTMATSGLWSRAASTASIPELASVWSDAIALYGLKSPDEDLERIERVTVAEGKQALAA